MSIFSINTNVYKRGLLKSITLIMVCIFLCTIGAGDIFLCEIAQAAKIPLKQIGIGATVKNFELPQHLGLISDRVDLDSERTIIHIQDAHSNYDAQKKILEIISYLCKKYSIDIINLEGGKNNYDVSIFTRIHDKDIRDKIVDYYVRLGIVNGAEYFAISNPGSVKLWGVEDTTLYVENFNVYRKSLTYKDSANKYLELLNYVLNNLKRHIYSADLFKLDQKYSQYKTGELEFREYLSYLIEKAEENSINIESFANISLLKQSLGEEKKVDFEKATKERSRLIGRLEEKLSRKELDQLALRTLELKNEKITTRDFYKYLVNKARLANIDPRQFIELQKYTYYISVYSTADKTKIAKELNILESEIMEKMVKTNTERELVILSKTLILTANIFSLTLKREDYRYYKDNKDIFKVQNYISFIKKNAPRYRINMEFDKNIYDLDEYREGISRFYEYSFKRDDAFLKNIQFTDERLQDAGHKKQVTILVTGGFHAENLCELFRKNNISCVSIIPAFKNPKDYECPYFRILAGDAVYDGVMKTLVVQLYGLQIQSYLANNAEKVLGRDGIDSFRLSVILREKLLLKSDRSLVVTGHDNETTYRYMMDEAGNVTAFLMPGVSHGDIGISELALEAGAYDVRGAFLKDVSVYDEAAIISVPVNVEKLWRQKAMAAPLDKKEIRGQKITAKFITDDQEAPMPEGVSAYNFRIGDTLVIVTHRDLEDPIRDEVIYHDYREDYWLKRLAAEEERLPEDVRKRVAHILAAAEEVFEFGKDNLTPYHERQISPEYMPHIKRLGLLKEKNRSFHIGIVKKYFGEESEITRHYENYSKRFRTELFRGLLAGTVEYKVYLETIKELFSDESEGQISDDMDINLSNLSLYNPLYFADESRLLFPGSSDIDVHGSIYYKGLTFPKDYSASIVPMEEVGAYLQWFAERRRSFGEDFKPVDVDNGTLLGLFRLAQTFYQDEGKALTDIQRRLNENIEKELMEWIKNINNSRVIAVIVSGALQVKEKMGKKRWDKLKAIINIKYGISAKQLVGLEGIIKKLDYYRSVNLVSAQPRAPPPDYFEQFQKRNIYGQLDSGIGIFVDRAQSINVEELKRWVGDELRKLIGEDKYDRVKIKSIVVFGSFLYGFRVSPSDIDLKVIVDDHEGLMKSQIKQPFIIPAGYRVFNSEYGRKTDSADITFLTEEMLKEGSLGTHISSAGIVLRGPGLLDVPEMEMSLINRFVWARQLINEGRRKTKAMTPAKDVARWRNKAMRRMLEANLLISSVDASVAVPKEIIALTIMRTVKFLNEEISEEEIREELLALNQYLVNSLLMAQTSYIWQQLEAMKSMASGDYTLKGDLEAGKGKAEVITIEAGETIIDPGLPVTQSLNDTEGREKMEEFLTSIIEEAIGGSAQNLMDRQPSIINIPLNADLAGFIGKMGEAEFSKKLFELKNRVLLEKTVETFKLGNITINFFADTPNGRSKLLDKRIKDEVQKWGVSGEAAKRRIITFSFVDKDKTDVDDKRNINEIERNSFVLYLQGGKEEGKFATTTPINACFSAGLNMLNLFELTRLDREVSPDDADIENATVSTVHSIVALSGTIDEAMISSLLARIKEKDGLINLSGLIYVKVRPINWNEIIRFHEMEAQVLRSL